MQGHSYSDGNAKGPILERRQKGCQAFGEIVNADRQRGELPRAHQAPVPKVMIVHSRCRFFSGFSRRSKKHRNRGAGVVKRRGLRF